MKNLHYLVLVLVAPLIALSIQARRLPEPGGSVRVTLSPKTEQEFINAHLNIPLLEPSRTNASITAPFYSTSSWTSSLIDSIRETKNHQTWVISPKLGQAAIISTVVSRCFSVKSKFPTRWPAKVIHLLGISHKTKLVQGEVTITFSKPVGPFPELLAGCSVGLDSASSKGAYVETNNRTLKQNPKSLIPSPLLDTIYLDAMTKAPHISQSRSKAASVNILVAPIPDVVLLIQPPKVMERDPLQIEPSAGLDQFLEHLGIPLLLSISNETYGRIAETILPPGIAPPLPLSKRRTLQTTQLKLPPLGENAPNYTLENNTDNPFLKHIADRLSVLFRHHGARLSTEKGNTDPLQLIRWHSPSKDPALAILHLGAAYFDLYNQLPHLLEPSIQRDLLSPNMEKRLEAALKTQRLWLTQRAIIPFATLSSWYEIHPYLMNIRISDEGIPLLHDAFWSNQP